MVLLGHEYSTAVTKPKLSANPATIPHGKWVATRSQGSQWLKRVFELRRDAGAGGWRAGEGVPTLCISFF